MQNIIQVFEKQETYHSITELKDQLLGIKNKKFWEVTDRGINFEYMNEEQKESLKFFFFLKSWSFNSVECRKSSFSKKIIF